MNVIIIKNYMQHDREMSETEKRWIDMRFLNDSINN